MVDFEDNNIKNVRGLLYRVYRNIVNTIEVGPAIKFIIIPFNESVLKDFLPPNENAYKLYTLILLKEDGGNVGNVYWGDNLFGLELNVEYSIIELSSLDSRYAYDRIMNNSTITIDWGDSIIETVEPNE
jgi:hypothetical protein